MVKRKNIAILGFGREGQSLFRFLRKRGQTRTGTRTNANITILDRNHRIIVPRGVPSVLGENYLRDLKQFNIIFRSPGVPYTLPQLYRARCESVTITSATKLFFELAAPYRKKLIGVTGTKGKGTTCALIAHILKTARKKVILAGNIGKPMLDILPYIGTVDYVILELSSFQLQDLSESPHIAAVVDVFPDHQDEHKSLREYYGSKANIGRWQKPGDAIFYFADNTLSKQIAAKSPARKISVRTSSHSRISAPHPRSSAIWKNYDMASAVARHLGANEQLIEKAIANFKGLPHRLELVRTITPRKQHTNKLENVRMLFVNDSAATNPVATAAAIRSFETRDKEQETRNTGNGSMSRVPCPMSLILLAGGRDKGLSYVPLAEAIQESNNVKLVILYGENRKKIKKALPKLPRPSRTMLAQRAAITNYQLQLVSDLKSAVSLAYRFARTQITNYPACVPAGRQLPVTILLSPASASFDQFKNYPDRGEQFKKLVHALKPYKISLY